MAAIPGAKSPHLSYLEYKSYCRCGRAIAKQEGEVRMILLPEDHYNNLILKTKPGQQHDCMFYRMDPIYGDGYPYCRIVADQVDCDGIQSNGCIRRNNKKYLDAYTLFEKIKATIKDNEDT